MAQPSCSVASEHFNVINLPSPQKEKWEDLAEHWRTKWFKLFVGEDIPYKEIATLKITVNDRLKVGGGQTTFVIDNSEVHNFRIEIQGPVEGMSNTVLPHEVMHTILASYYKRGLPRWADEGYCSYIEPIKVNMPWTTRYPFHAIMEMTDYPPDTKSFYMQSMSMVDWLINLKDLKTFRSFLEEAPFGGDHQPALLKYYNFKSYQEAEQAWNKRSLVKEL